MTPGQARERVRTAIAAAGTRPLARRLGHDRPGTVGAWRSAGRVPPRHWRVLNAALSDLGVGELSEDLLRAAYEREAKA